MALLFTVISLIAYSISMADAGTNSSIHNHIIGGVVATIDKNPWQASMRAYGAHICGASIISTLWVLTAAHCVVYPASVTSFQFGTAVRSIGGTIIDADSVTVHPDYKKRASHDNDAALYKLKSPLTFSSTIRSIALPSAGLVMNAGTKTLVSGWGTTVVGGSSTNQLMFVEVPVVSTTACQAAYGTSAITDAMICASEGGKDSCQGDSGGPLSTLISNILVPAEPSPMEMAKRDIRGRLAYPTSTRTLIGIVSWGISCALPQYPGVYTYVPAIRTWIKTTSGV